MQAPDRLTRERMQRDLRERLRRNRFSHFVTLAANDPMFDVPRMRRLLRDWDARVCRYLIGPRWVTKPDERPVWFAFFEGRAANPHWHLLLELDPGAPEGSERAMRAEQFPLEAEREWRKICRSGSVDVQAYRSDDVIDYATKHLTRPEALESFVTSLEFIRA